MVFYPRADNLRLLIRTSYKRWWGGKWNDYEILQTRFNGIHIFLSNNGFYTFLAESTREKKENSVDPVATQVNDEKSVKKDLILVVKIFLCECYILARVLSFFVRSNCICTIVLIALPRFWLRFWRLKKIYSLQNWYQNLRKDM